MLNPSISVRGAAASLDLARVLLVHGDLASRLALQTILQAGGYAVDVAVTPSEALCCLDDQEYELVLCDSDIGTPEDGRKVLAYARVKDYRPATALITGSKPAPRSAAQHRVAIHTEDLPLLLGKVAELIGLRASRRYTRQLRAAV
jgi:DNA-binding NtrC family response regulator